jgi:hypothetical protein
MEARRLAFTDYDPKYLATEARSMARQHSKANGGGRILGVTYNVRVSNTGAWLKVAYHANRPDGNCGRYETSVAL